MKFRVRIYDDNNVVVGVITPDRDTVEHLGRQGIENLLKHGKVEFVEEVEE